MKFRPILKAKIWGGKRLKKHLNKDCDSSLKIGESWEIATVDDDVSIVANGHLAGRDLIDVIREFKGNLLGQKVYAEYGLNFPLLLKFIDANDRLSVQVHPDDKTAKLRHDAYGKTEMWYVVDAEQDAELVLGFKSKICADTLEKSIEGLCLEDLLNKEKVKKGDIFFIPPGCVHSIGLGILIAEIQQSSDITYRLYDYNRKDIFGNYRELHLEFAKDVMNLNGDDKGRVSYVLQEEGCSHIVSCKYFSTNILHFSDGIRRDYSNIDSFIVYMCLDGGFEVVCDGRECVSVCVGETVLVPSCLKDIQLLAKATSKVLEIYID